VDERPFGAPGRVGSAFAAELGTMAVSEQTDSLRVLGTDPVDYLITPRVLSCMIAGPILNVMCFTMGVLTGHPFFFSFFSLHFSSPYWPPAFPFPSSLPFSSFRLGLTAVWFS
jgi:ABC-type transporter Mla maintaining outer membrane lipid asymmetry permease subunit MlaE